MEEFNVEEVKVLRRKYIYLSPSLGERDELQYPK